MAVLYWGIRGFPGIVLCRRPHVASGEPTCKPRAMFAIFSALPLPLYARVLPYILLSLYPPFSLSFLFPADLPLVPVFFSQQRGHAYTFTSSLAAFTLPSPGRGFLLPPFAGFPFQCLQYFTFCVHLMLSFPSLPYRRPFGASGFQFLCNLMIIIFFLWFPTSSEDTPTLTGPHWRLQPIACLLHRAHRRPIGASGSVLHLFISLFTAVVVSSGDTPTHTGPHWRRHLGIAYPTTLPLFFSAIRAQHPAAGTRLHLQVLSGGCGPPTEPPKICSFFCVLQSAAWTRLHLQVHAGGCPHAFPLLGASLTVFFHLPLLKLFLSSVSRFRRTPFLALWTL